MPQKQIKTVQMLLEEAIRIQNSEQEETSSVTQSSCAFEDEIKAQTAFEYFCQKLFRISEWNSESELSSFYLYDENGNEQPEKAATTSDFIKIILPGSGKADWVKIIEVSKLESETILTVQPSNDPTSAENSRTTSHFFDNDSTNNFCLQKVNLKINFYVIGLNEKPNTEDTSSVLETIRNYATANIASFLGIQKAQWKTFCENFLEVKKGEK